MAGFKPLHDRVLVRRVEVAERTPGGIIIPDAAKENPVEGETLAVGPGARDPASSSHSMSKLGISSFSTDGGDGGNHCR